MLFLFYLKNLLLIFVPINIILNPTINMTEFPLAEALHKAK